MFDEHCSQMMWDYFGIWNMYVNHAIVVIWVLLLSVLGESKILFSTFYYCFGLWFLTIQIYHFYHYWYSFWPYCWSFWCYIWPDRPFNVIVTGSFHNIGNWIYFYTSDLVKVHHIKLCKRIFKFNIAWRWLIMIKTGQKLYIQPVKVKPVISMIARRGPQTIYTMCVHKRIILYFW